MITVQRSKVLQSSNREYGLVLKTDTDKILDIRLPSIGVSRAGDELLRLAAKDSSSENPDIRKKVGMFIKDSNKSKNLQVAIVKAESADPESGTRQYIEV